MNIEALDKAVDDYEEYRPDSVEYGEILKMKIQIEIARQLKRIAEHLEEQIKMKRGW